MNYKLLVLLFLLIGFVSLNYAQTVTLSSDVQIGTANILQGAIRHSLFHFHLYRPNGGANNNLTGINFTTSGTYQATDAAKFQLWSATTDNFASASQLSSDITTNLGTGSHSFAAFSQQLAKGASLYYWITTDLTEFADIGKTIGIDAWTTSNFSISAGTKAGSASAGGTQTIVFNSSPTDYFRSFTSGNWSSAGTWESSHDNVNWEAATSGPTAAANTINILNGHTVTVAVGVSTDQTTVETGGQIQVSSGITLTIANGTGTDLTVNGTLRNNAGTITTTGTLAFGSGGLFQSNFTTAVGLIPTASWDTNSTCEIIGYTSFGGTQTGLGQSFGNLIWNCPLQTGNISAAGALVTVNGDLTITATNTGQFRLAAGTTPTLALNGDLIISGGTLNMSSGTGTPIINLKGDFRMSGGTLTESSSGTGTINFAGTTAQIISITGSPTISNTINFAVNNNAILEFENATTVLSGTSGSFTANSGATLIIKHAAGISPQGTFTGCIQNSGTKTFNVAANYTYAGEATQVSGTAYPNGGTGILTVNTSTGVSFSLSASRTIGTNGKIYLTSGIFAAGTSLSMGSGSSITRSEGAMTGTIQGAAAYSVFYNGNSKTTGSELSGSGLGNITLDLSSGTNTLTLDRTVTVDNGEVLTFTMGSITLADFNIIMNGSYTGTNLFIYSGTGALGGGMVGSDANVLVTVASPSSMPAVVNTLDVAPGVGNTATLPSDVTTTILTFTNGSLAFNGYTITLANKDFALTGSNSISALNVSLFNTAQTWNSYTSIAHTWQTNGTFIGTLDIVFAYPSTLSTSPEMMVVNRDHTIGETIWNFVDIINSVSHTTYYTISLPGVVTLNGSTKGDLDWTLTETDQELPVELSSFTATLSQGTYVTLTWVTQSETNEIGFNVFRNHINDLSTAVQVNANIIGATNTSYEHTYYFRDVIVTDDDYYYYWLQDVTNNGVVTFHGPVMVDLGNHGGVTPPPDIPLSTSVQSIYPNPFTPTATINYGLKTKGMANIKIYNARGQLVRTILDEEKEANNYRTSWDGKDKNGNSCASGIYIIELTSGTVRSSLKAILMK